MIDHLYDSAPLSNGKTIHLVIRHRSDDEPLLEPRDVIVLMRDPDKGTVPVQMVHARKNVEETPR